MNNVTLIGMPGSGKSTIGVILAKALGYQFLDTDLLIQKEEKRKLSEIIEQEGPERFKEIENRVNASIDVNHTVIATGGLAKKIVPHCRREIILDDDLLLKGLAIIYKKNRK